MRRNKAMHRLTAVFLSALLCMSCIGSPMAFAAGPSRAHLSESTDGENPEYLNEPPLAENPEYLNEPPLGEDSDYLNESPLAESDFELSDAAQAFINAVNALDREKILSTANAWGLAHRAWEQDQDNEALKATLDEAVEASDAAVVPLYAAEDQFYALSEAEQEDAAVQAAFASLMTLTVAMQTAMDHPTDPSTGGGEPPLEEIAAVLYDTLPDAPTGSYIGSRGLPVAVGETKIGIGEWSADLLTGTNSRMDANALNNDGLSITVPRQAGEAFAIVPILTQVEYPANGSSAHIVLPENAVLLSQDGSGNAASPDEVERILHSTYSETSAAISGIFVQADEDFTACLVYTDADSNTLEKSLDVHIDKSIESASPALYAAGGIALYEERPTPAVTTGKVTDTQNVNGMWLIWFNGEEAYCCNYGAWAAPAGCPTYTYSHTSIIGGDQYTPGDHYSNQINIWGGLGQMSLGLLSENSSGLYTAAEATACYTDAQKWVIEHYPDSDAGRAYRSAVDALVSGVTPYFVDYDLYAYIYQPPAGTFGGHSEWQTISVVGPKVTPPEYYADWETEPQTASDEFDLTFTVNADKVQLTTHEKVDGAVIEIEPVVSSGYISGGMWTFDPAGRQIITTSGHTMDNAYQDNGGSGTASWTLHYSVSKTSSTTMSGHEGPYKTQAEADAAAEAAKEAAIAQLQDEAQEMVDEAMEQARKELSSLQFTYVETGIPHGFDAYAGSLGSNQTITVSANANEEYIMRNDEWSLQVRIDKRDSETGEQIRGAASFAIFEWDTAAQRYVPFGGYNQYKVERQADGTYTVINHSAYATADPARSTMYFTQRNEGKFIIAETQAPAGYYGDWTDITHPGEAGSVLGKRAYAITITKANDGSVIWLDNADYNTNIGTANNGGTLLDTGSAVVSVTISDNPILATKTYITDSTGIANNEDGRTVIPVHGVFQNDRAVGEIILSKVDLDTMHYLSAGSNGNATLEGAVYDLYAAEDIAHPDGVSGIVDYSKITDASGNPLWHTTVLTNSGWVSNYLPVLQKDHLVASAAITDGKLAFTNLYLGRYYLVERATGVILPLDNNGQMIAPTTYPVLDRHLQPTGDTRPLAVGKSGEYTDYLYHNRYSSVAVGRAADGSRTYDGYYLSFASGYLCDEVNHYVTLAYGNESGLVTQQEIRSEDEVLKSGFSLTKLMSTTGQSSPAERLDGAGFTVFRISALSKVDQFVQNPDGGYQVQSILDAYRADSYDQDTPKYDFDAETQAIATMYEGSTTVVEHYNQTLTGSADNVNGSGLGWQPTGTPNEYRLSEVYTNEDGILRVDGLAYGQYLVIETTVPEDVFQAAPFIVSIDGNSPQSVFCTPQGSQTTQSGSYMAFNILDEQLEGYLQLAKVDAETGEVVKLANTAFSIFSIGEDGVLQLVEMTDPRSGDVTKKTSVFYTDSEGLMKTPEKLSIGRYRIVEVQGPEGYFNDESYHVDFQIGSGGAFEVVGSNANSMDNYIITEKYYNHETLGRLTLRKEGEVLTGIQNGQFVYEKDALAGAVFEIRAHGDIYTADHQTDAAGNRTLWYADGDLVATVTTGADGQVDKTEFAPARTPSTYNFLSVSHNGSKGEVTLTLPLGSYDVREIKAPYGYTLSGDTYTVTLGWADQTNDLVLAETIVSCIDGKEAEKTYQIINVSDAGKEQAAEQKIVYLNERVRSVVEKGRVGVGLYKLDRDSAGFAEDTIYESNTKGEIPAGAVPIAGATYELYTTDAIYSVDGKLLADADTLLGTATTGEDGLASFEIDIPIRGEQYGTSDAHDATTNSGRYYLIEVAASDGYLIEQSKIPVEFVYEGQQTVYQVVGGLHTDKVTEVEITKHGFAGSDAADSFILSGAELVVTDKNGKVVDAWTSGDEAHTICGLLLGCEYTLTETRPADGYTTARAIKFKLSQAKNEDGSYAQRTEVWVLTETPSAEVISGSIVSPVKFADDEAPAGIFATLKGVVLSLVDTLTGNAEDEDTPEQAAVIADWQLINGTLIVSFTKEATDTATEKCLRESDFAEYEVERVFIENGAAPDFFADIQIAEKPDDAEITCTGEWVLCEAVTMLDAPTTIRVSKVDITTHEEVEGAALQVTNQDGNVIDEWISGSEPHMIEGKLIAGETYVLTETLAPTKQGYVPAISIEFVVQDDGKVQTVFMQDDYTKLFIHKTDIATGEELPGATLQIIGENGEIIAEWISESEPHYIERIPAGKYTLIETAAPDGYIVSKSVEFEILPTGEIQSVEMKDDFTKIDISKADIATGEELPGAHLQIVNENGDVVDEWTSTNTPHRIEHLPAGKYTLVETSAPAGYLIAKSVPFEVEPTGEVQQITMQDDFIKVDISKQDITTGAELPGAKLRIVDESGKTIEEWVSTDTPYRIERLPAGKYTLVEVSAPAGYAIAESITFEVEQTGEIQRVEMKDTRIPDTPSVPQTGDLPWLPAALGITALLALAGFAAWKIIEKRRKEDA